MSFSAIIPIASLVSANAALELAGFGPNNFSVPAYTGAGPSHAALHSWADAAFQAAVVAIPGAIVSATGTDPIAKTQALIAAQGAKWASKSPVLPATGTVTAGNLYTVGNDVWFVIQTFNRTTFGAAPETYPALMRRVRSPLAVEAWKQPTDQFDAYNLINPFTGRPDRCLFNGKIYATKINANTFSPAGYPAGWQEVSA